MAIISEETTKGLVAGKLKNIIGYPTAQNTKVDGITWFKEDSYIGGKNGQASYKFNYILN